MIVGAGYEIRPRPDLDWGGYTNFHIIDPGGNLAWRVEVHPRVYPGGSVAELWEHGQRPAYGIFVDRDGTAITGSGGHRRRPGEFGPILDILREAGVAFPGEEDGRGHGGPGPGRTGR